MARHYLTLSERAESEGESKAAEESRKALGDLCKSQTSSRVGVSTQKQGLGNIPRGAKPTSDENSNKRFDIFADQTPHDSLAENGLWKNLPKDKEARKENEGIKLILISIYY